MPTYLLAHDLGTSGNKATLFTAEGTLVKSVTYPYALHVEHGTWIDQDADAWWKAICESTQELLNGISPADVAAAPALPLMLGRGLQRDPSLLRRLRGGERATAAQLQAYHDALCAAYRRDYSGDTPVLHRMRELWSYLSGSFRDTDAFLRAVRKARTLSAYDQAARAFFAQARLSEE